MIKIFANNTINFDLLETCPVDYHHYPHGWTNATEINLLYTIAKNVSGPVLEIGPWLGRSTIAIAAGVRDSAEAKTFDTIDYGLTSIAEWREMLQDDFSQFVENDEVIRNVHCMGGSLAALIDNVRRAGLLPHVTTFIRGDFLNVPKRPAYSMVFCDTLHDEREVHKYAAEIDKLLVPGGWLVCDDVLDERLGAIVEQYISCDVSVYSHASDQYSKFMIVRKK